uniref:Galactosylgalactosylxylosylprotein 3-beta-glucuronosyltransferase n=1 Tax=Panagrellus redivivus TaxID=6233 RepID=A0A7E4UXK8_PANRE
MNYIFSQPVTASPNSKPPNTWLKLALLRWRTMSRSMSPHPRNFIESPSPILRPTSPSTILVDDDSSDGGRKYDHGGADKASSDSFGSYTRRKYRNSPSPVLFSASPTFLGSLRRRLPSLVVTVLLILLIIQTWQWGLTVTQDPTIIIITPTHKRPERLADMTRFAQTLMHVKNIHWIVIEDANHTVDAVDRLLQRTNIPYVYFFTTTKPGFPKRGWTHRNMGLEYVRKHYADYNKEAVVYFADDDNSYDIRLFDRYVRKVKTIGVWPVGLVGGAIVEAPHVENGTITKWDVIYAPSRKFAVDMAGFAVNLRNILATNASFNEGCTKSAPESCFLSQFGLDKSKVEPFGHDDVPKDLLVWHTKTRNIGTKGGTYNFTIER